MSLFPAFRTAAADGNIKEKDDQTQRGAARLFPSATLRGTQASVTENSEFTGFNFSFDAQKSLQTESPQQSVKLPDRVLAEFSSEDEIDDRKLDQKDAASVRSEERRDKSTKKRKRRDRKRYDFVEAVVNFPAEVKLKPKRVKHPELQKKEDEYLRRNAKFVFLSEANVPPEEAFCLDEKPDAINLTFDSTYWKSIPKFQNPPRWMLGEAKRKWKKKSDPRYFDESAELKVMRSSLVMHPPPTPDIVPFGRNYLPLPEDEPDILVPDEDLSGMYDIQRATTASFNEKLRVNPHDIQLWLDFLRFQDEYMRHGFAKPDEKSTRMNHTSLQERKIAILEKAIEQNPTSVELKLRRLAMCEDVWEKERLTSEWGKFAFDHPNDASIWREYLLFLQSYFTTFSFTKVGKAYQKFLTVSQTISQGTFYSHKARPYHDVHVSYFVYFLSSFWMQSGYQEKAIALQQAWLELNLRFPSKLNSTIPLKDALVFMEPFWDSGVPRFGEKNSPGWNTVTDHPSKVPPNTEHTSENLDQAEDTLAVSSSTSMELWMKLEQLRQEHYLVPYHGTEDVIDSERTVLFDDISPYLYRVPSRPETTHVLFSAVINCLSLLHCAMPRLHSTNSHAFKSLLPSALEVPYTSFFSNWTESHCSLASSDSYAKTLFCPLQSTWSGGDHLISGVIEQSLSTFKGLPRAFLCVCWLQYYIHKFIQSTTDKRAPVTKEVRALAKSLLKQPENRNNLLVWEWYAFAEGQLEASPAATLRILQTVLSSTQIEPDNSEQFLLLGRVIRFYAESLLETTNQSRISVDSSSQRKAASILAQFVEGGRFDPSQEKELSQAQILKYRIVFQKKLKEAKALDESDISFLVALGSRFCNTVICGALFEYLTSGFEAAFELISGACSQLKKEMEEAKGMDFDLTTERSAMDREILTEFLCRLALYQQRQASLSSSRLREILLNGLKDFPNNSQLLHAFVSTEVSAFISGRLRGYFDSVLDESTTEVPWVFAVFSEYERKYRLWKNLNNARMTDLVTDVEVSTYRDTGMSHKLRSLFERAVESRVGRHSPLLWRLYLRFEMEEDNLRSAEGVYYRALQSCPWAKVLYIDAIKCFPLRIQEILDLMTEKEIRVLTFFDEVELLLKSKSVT